MESWPVVTAELEIDHATVRRNLERVRDFLAAKSLEVLVVTSNDRHLNEYTPRHDNQRYFLSGFTGSTALMLVPRTGRAKLFVDGRYHIQAGLQVDERDVEVVKVPFGQFITTALYDRIRGQSGVGYDAERVSKAMEDAISGAAASAVAIEPGQLDALLEQRPIEHKKPVAFVDARIAGRGPAQKLEAVFAQVAEPDTTVILLSALDDIAWLTDGRGYHFIYQSSFAARGFAVRDKVHVSLEKSVLDRGLEGAPPAIVWHAQTPEAILASPQFDHIRTVSYDPQSTTAAAVRGIASIRPKWKLTAQPSPVVAVKAVKTPEELAHFDTINDRSSRAVADAIRWVRRRIAAGERVSEIDFYEAANGFYAAQGARDLSFHTIAAIGSDSAIIHFSEPRDSVVASSDDLMLLDSGALYEGGFATDITRTFLAGGRRGRASQKAKELYTLVLKGLLNAMTAIFPEGTRGSFLDALARQPIYAAGYDYGHGTGHGVGIHVHEPGVGLSPTSTLPLKAGHVSSIEPGIYIPDFGGVRLENVVVYEPEASHAGFLKARSLNFVGFDRCLIDESMLGAPERAALAAYQNECKRRGTDYDDAV